MLAGGLDAREGALVLYFELALARHRGDVVVGDAPRWRRYKLRGQEKSCRKCGTDFICSGNFRCQASKS